MPVPDWWNSTEPDIHKCVQGFSSKLQAKIEELQPHKVIEKNPFLYRARNPENAYELANHLLSAFLSSSEETMFGDILEEISIVICAASRLGRKSGIQGIDVEYDDELGRTLIQVKSGRNWGNSSQQKKLKENFASATKVLRQGSRIQVRCVEGICYGPSETKDKGSHIRIVGNDYWADVCGWRDAGRYILHIVGSHAGNGMHDLKARACEDIVSYFRETDICDNRGRVNWDRLFDLIMTPVARRPRPHANLRIRDVVS